MLNTLVSLLGGDLVMKDGSWHSHDLYIRNSCPASIFESFRVAAAIVLLEIDKEAKVVVQGGLANDLYPSLAKIMKEELIEAGIENNRILLEEKSEKTIQQLYELQQLSIQHVPKTIKILSNDWHLPRIQIMIESLEELNKLHSFSPIYIAAEDLLLSHDTKKWKKTIATIRKSPQLKEIIFKEQQGIKQLLLGTYKF